jgi:hypothetical protein
MRVRVTIDHIGVEARLLAAGERDRFNAELQASLRSALSQGMLASVVRSSRSVQAAQARAELPVHPRAGLGAGLGEAVSSQVLRHVPSRARR